MRLEARELVRPQRLGLGEPLLEFRRRAVLQSIDSHARVERRMPVLDQPALLQRAQMPTHRGRREAERARQFAGAARPLAKQLDRAPPRSEEHTSELQSLMRISYAVFCLKK